MNTFSPSSTPLVDEDSTYYYSGDGEILFLEKSWFLYAVAACAVLLVFTVFLVIILLAKRCSNSWRAKISFRSTECDYDDIVDRTIVELFEVLDKRSQPPVETTCSVIETDLNPIGSINNTLSFDHQLSPVEVIVNSHPSSPNSVSSSTNKQSLTIEGNTSAVDLKPLAVKSSFMMSNESVYDNLEDSEARTKEAKDSDQGVSTLPSSSTYDDTIISPVKKDTKVPRNKDTIYDDTMPQSPIKEADYAIPDCVGGSTKKSNTDDIGYYILPDNFPPPPQGHDYSYTATHNLVPKAGGETGEVRSQGATSMGPGSQGAAFVGPVSPVGSSVYTDIDGIGPATLNYQNISGPPVNDPTYSKIDDVEQSYLYATEHMLVSPKRSNVGEVVMKPEGHHVYDPIITTAAKSKSLPGSNCDKTKSEHTYANLKPSHSVKGRSEQTQMEVAIIPALQESINPLYGSSDDILSTLQIETKNPIYDSANSQPKSSTRESVEMTSSSKEKDYLASTDTWLQPRSSSIAGHCSQPEITVPPLDDTDHTYMGIFVRDRVDHDYTVPKTKNVPKNMVSFSSESSIKKVKDQRSHSLNNHKYQNQSMWLRNMDDSSSSQDTSSGYMGLHGGSYETSYTIPNLKHTFSHSRV